MNERVAGVIGMANECRYALETGRKFSDLDVE
jgi:hypothetical protein